MAQSLTRYRPGTVLTDAERTDVYRVALEFLALVGELVARRGFADLRDQLERASASIVLNTAEAMVPQCLRAETRYEKRRSCAR